MLISFKLLMLNAVIFILLPILLPQGFQVRARTLRLPEPEGKRVYQSSRDKPYPAHISLLIAGDSAAAGVGASHQSYALSGRLLSGLSRNYEVSWRVCAKTGHKSADLIDNLTALDASNIDVAIISIGVNDVTGFTSMSQWRRNIELIIDKLLTHHQCRLIVFTALPPMHLFPALPQPLRWVLGQRARRLNELLVNRADKYSRVRVLSPSLIPSDNANHFIAEDGFHPSEAGYAHWGEAAVKLVTEEVDGLVGNSKHSG